MIAPVFVKRLGFAVLALVLAGLCAALILPFLISADAVRDAVQGEIRSVTGLDPRRRVAPARDAGSRAARQNSSVAVSNRQRELRKHQPG